MGHVSQDQDGVSAGLINGRYFGVSKDEKKKKQEVGMGVVCSIGCISSVEVSLSSLLEYSSSQYFHALVFLAFAVSDLWVALLFFVSCLSITFTSAINFSSIFILIYKNQQ